MKRGKCRSRAAHPTWRSELWLIRIKRKRYDDGNIPIRLVGEGRGGVTVSTTNREKRAIRILTGAERVVGTLELLAGCEFLALCRNTLEVIGVVLEAVEVVRVIDQE